jgi:hypothetical protein
VAGWRSRVKDGLTRVGALDRAKRTLWSVRYHRDRLTGAFVMEPVAVPGLAPDPIQVEVRLDALRHLSRLHVWERRYAGALVFAGNWDERLKHPRPPLSSPPAPGDGDLGGYAHLTVLDLFVHGRSHRETAEWAHLAERIERGGRPRGCASLVELDAHFAQLADDDVAISRGEFGRRDAHGRLQPFAVQVFMDRHGELIHRSGGLHQLRLAELRELERIPVRLMAAHADWAIPHLSGALDAAPADVLSSAIGMAIDEELEG